TSNMVGALGTVPEWANIVEESTANGFTAHKERWHMCEGTSSAFFFPASDSPEYRLRIPENFERTEKEKRLRAVRILAGEIVEEEIPDAHIVWRRSRYNEFLKIGQPEKLRQEFPLTPTEAFYASAGDSYYPTEYLGALYEEMRLLEILEIFEVGD